MATKGSRAEQCSNGHPFTPENTYVITRDRGTYQRCRTCETERRYENREWMKSYMLDRRYGITKKQRSDILVSQDGLCALCYERPAVTVDHDHTTGRVRGMLCKGCNVALGVLGDDAESLANVTDYLMQEGEVA